MKEWSPAALKSPVDPYDVLAFPGPTGCVLGEHWVIHGMDHFWSGGTTDPMYAQFTNAATTEARPWPMVGAWLFVSFVSLIATIVPMTLALKHVDQLEM